MMSELSCDISDSFRIWIDDIAHMPILPDDPPCCQEHPPFFWVGTTETSFQSSIAIIIDPNDHVFEDGKDLPGFRELAEHLDPIKNYCSENSLELFVYNSGSRVDLIKALGHGHLIVIVYHHGTTDGILCSEGGIISYFGDFDKISLKMGCLISHSCWGNEAKVGVIDEEDEFHDEVDEFTLLEWLQHKNITCGFVSIEEGHYSTQTKHQIDESMLNAYMISLLLTRDFKSAWRHYRKNAPVGFHEHFRPFGNMKLKLSELIKREEKTLG
jgi:hypothetical protein